MMCKQLQCKNFSSTECRLDNVMLLHCHKDIADGIDLTNIAKSLYQLLSETNYFGSFV